MVHSPDDQPTDAVLMRKLAAGDADALALLVRRHQEVVVNLFRRLGARRDDAEDCAQETFLRLYLYRDRYRPTDRRNGGTSEVPFRGFLFTLARHAWLDHARKARRRPTVRLDAVREGYEPTVGDCRTEIDRRLDLDAALSRLPEPHAWVVGLSVYAGLSQDEIARLLEIPVGTVKSRMHYGLRKLREAMHVEGRRDAGTGGG